MWNRRGFPFDAGKPRELIINKHKGFEFCLVNDRKSPIRVLTSWDLTALIVGLFV